LCAGLWLGRMGSQWRSSAHGCSRLLYCAHDARSGGVYLAHVGLIARAAGRSGRLARLVKIADLQDRCHPRVRADGWSPPYARGLALLIGHDARRATAV
jgi:hypothetical protein